MSLPLQRQVAHALKGSRAALAPSSSLSAPAQKLPRSRIYRPPRSIIPPTFYFQRDQNSRTFTSSKFQLNIRTIPDDIVKEINEGPTWLRGAYPPNTLPKRHERRRLLHSIPISTWRQGNESESDVLRIEKEMGALALRRSPILDGNNKDIDRIPAIIIATKKKIDKRAVVRNAACRKLWVALDSAVRRLEKGPYRVPSDSTKALILIPSKEVGTTTTEDLVEEVSKALIEAIHKQSTKTTNKRPRGMQTSGINGRLRRSLPKPRQSNR